jgi:methylthioribose-1-phosphate isomerase
MARRAAEPDHDPSRREFFKTFSRQTIQNAGAVAGAASEIRRTSLAAARELLDMETLTGTGTPTLRVAAPADAKASAPPETFRSPYRFSGTAVVVLDQRELPERVVTFECHAGNDVASALRSGAITPGPVMGQVAAYGICVAAVGVAERSEESRDQVIHAAAGAIKAARGEVHAVAAAIERMIGKYEKLANDNAAGAAIAEGLTQEADGIAIDATAACAEIGRRWSELLAGAELDLLVHGDGGPLACGMVGMSTSAIQALIGAGRRMHVWVTAGAPSLEGARITALQLAQLDIPHTVIPDSAVGWLIAGRRIDAVVLRGDTIANNGETETLLGARAVAQLAHDAGVPVHVLAPEAAWDRTKPDASHLVLDLRSAAELGTTTSARLDPPFDTVPARNVAAYVSEKVVVRPPFKEAR